MAIIKCKMCGGDLNLIEGQSVAECEYCGSRQTVPSADSEKKLTLFARANRLRAACEFDKAAGIYEAIVADFPEEAEAYWGLVLCKYGIEYVDDPASGKKIPTCHRSSFDSVIDDSNFEQAVENADEEALRVYRQEAKQIEGIRKGILEVSSSEKPYDVFICYKETDSSGDRTIDSLLAQDLYDALTGKGYRVFFSRITLEDKLGQAYEPYIFAALNSAKIMLAVGTCYEHYNAVWVKNEWSRYLKIIAQDKNKYLIPCYKNIDAYDIPKEFAHLQGQDMGKVGAIQDLLRGVEKILPKEHVALEEQLLIQRMSATPSVESLLKRSFIFLSEENWERADEYCEKVLDIDPECAKAYFGKLLVELRVKTPDALNQYAESFVDKENYVKAVQYADVSFKQELESYAKRFLQMRGDASGERSIIAHKYEAYLSDYPQLKNKQWTTAVKSNLIQLLEETRIGQKGFPVYIFAFLLLSVACIATGIDDKAFMGIVVGLIFAAVFVVLYVFQVYLKRAGLIRAISEYEQKTMAFSDIPDFYTYAPEMTQYKAACDAYILEKGTIIGSEMEDWNRRKEEILKAREAEIHMLVSQIETDYHNQMSLLVNSEQAIKDKYQRKQMQLEQEKNDKTAKFMKLNIFQVTEKKNIRERLEKIEEQLARIPEKLSSELESSQNRKAEALNNYHYQKQRIVQTIDAKYPIPPSPVESVKANLMRVAEADAKRNTREEQRKLNIKDKKHIKDVLAKTKQYVYSQK